MTSTLVLRAERVVLPDGERAAAVQVENGKVTAILDRDATVEGATEVVLAADEVLLPGIVDAHVHVNEPGRTPWEGFASATRAAAAGGITTIVDMPLNSLPSTVSVAALDTKQDAARDQIVCDVGFWGGALPDNDADLKPLWDRGVFGFKCFLADSGVEEFPHLDAEQLGRAMTTIASFDGLIIVHAEDADTLAAAPQTPGRAFSDFLASRPQAAEVTAVQRVIDTMRETGCRAHILHLSASEALPAIRAAKAEGLPLTVETCPHYLTFDAEQIPDGETQYKCCPPLREHANRMALWQGLKDGDIDMIASDHSPCTADLKRFDTGDFAQAWGGISSVQLGLPAVWTEARKQGIPLTDVVRWMTEAPVAMTGLVGKGAIKVGNDADFAVFAPDEADTVDVRTLQHKNKVSPYDGRELTGVVRRTYLRGAEVDLDTTRGSFLTRH